MTAEALKEFRDGFRFAARSHVGVDAEIASARAELADWHLRRALDRIWPVRPAPVPAVKLGRFNPAATIPGMPSPALALAQRERSAKAQEDFETREAPFPLCKVKRLPGVPRTPTPASGTPRPGPTAPQHDPGSLFTRALAWTLKSRRA